MNRFKGRLLGNIIWVILFVLIHILKTIKTPFKKMYQVRNTTVVFHSFEVFEILILRIIMYFPVYLLFYFV